MGGFGNIEAVGRRTGFEDASVDKGVFIGGNENKGLVAAPGLEVAESNLGNEKGVD